MTDLVEQLANYGRHFDRAIGHGEGLAESDNNPVLGSDTDEGDLIVVDLQPRTSTGSQEEGPHRRWPTLVALSAAAVILIVVAIAVFSDADENAELDVVNSPDSDEPTVTAGPPPFGPESSLALVEAYYAAAEAGDTAAVTATFTTDAEVSGGIADLDEHLRTLAWDAGQDKIFVDRSCTVDVADPTSVVIICEYGDHQYLQRVVGAPATPKTEVFTVTPAGIAEFDENYGEPLFPASDGFELWMRANNPDDVARSGCCGGDTIEQARADGELRRTYGDLWAAYLEDNDCTYLDRC